MKSLAEGAVMNMTTIEAIEICIVNTQARINDLNAQLQGLTAYLDKLELMYEDEMLKHEEEI